MTKVIAVVDATVRKENLKFRLILSNFHSRPLRYRCTALPVELASQQLGADFRIPISEKTLGKMQKYGMRREWRRERKEVEVNFTDSLYEDRCFYPLGKPLLLFKFKCGPTSLSSSRRTLCFYLQPARNEKNSRGSGHHGEGSPIPYGVCTPRQSHGHQKETSPYYPPCHSPMTYTGEFR